jgi:hypothetical protein
MASQGKEDIDDVIKTGNLTIDGLLEHYQWSQLAREQFSYSVDDYRVTDVLMGLINDYPDQNYHSVSVATIDAADFIFV